MQITQVNGVGLCTNGLVWQDCDVYFYPNDVIGISTGWTPALGYSGNATMVLSTAWSPALGYSGNATLVISTAWTPSIAFGNETPE